MTLQEIIDSSDNIVFFGGAGVSTESGIPDFRSVDGLYNMKYDYPPETILSHTFFMNNTEEFYKFYRDKLIVKGVKPNKAHIALAKLEEKGKLKAVITQNIDGLHQMAGSGRCLQKCPKNCDSGGCYESDECGSNFPLSSGSGNGWHSSDISFKQSSLSSGHPCEYGNRFSDSLDVYG